jgi:hypothetical protein
MSGTFNYWVSGDVNGGFMYTLNPAPYSGHQLTLTEYESDLTFDIWGGGPVNSNGFPLAADTEQVPNGTHLFGHPINLEIQHWIALYGYSTSGQFTDYIDPVFGSSLNYTAGFAVSAFNTSYPSSDMLTLLTDAGRHGGPYGIAW